MDLMNIKKGLQELFPLFHIKKDVPVEHVFDLVTYDPVGVFLILENIDYGYPLYVKVDLRTGLLSECYPMFYKDFKTSIEQLGKKIEEENLKSYISVPIKFENDKYSFEELDSYPMYTPQADKHLIERTQDGEIDRTYLQVNKLSDVSFPIYWKVREMILNSSPDYIIFYFKNNEKKPDKVLVGTNPDNEKYAQVNRIASLLSSLGV